MNRTSPGPTVCPAWLIILWKNSSHVHFCFQDMWSSFSVTVILEDPSDSSWTGTLSPPHLPLQWRTCSEYRVPGSVDSVWRATTQTNMLYQPSKVIWMEVCWCSVRSFSMLLWRGLIFTCCVDRESVYCFIIMFIDIILSIKGKKNNHREDMNFTKHQNIL